MTDRRRHAGILLLLGIAVAMIWRVAVAPAVLGDFDPASMPHRDRAFLSVGNVGVAVLFAVALAMLAAGYTSARNGQLSRAGAAVAFAGAAVAALATLGLVWWSAPQFGLWAYLVCGAAAWLLSGYATFREFRGIVGWAALLTAVLYGLALIVVVSGGHVIFLMTMGAAPFAIALIVTAPRRPAIRRQAGTSTVAS